MKCFYSLTLSAMLVLMPVTAWAQASQVTAMGGYIIETPKMDIQGGNVRLTFATNFYCYVFPVEGPSAPITEPFRPDPSAWGPDHVDIAGNGSDVYILYTDFNPEKNHFELRLATSTNGGSEWSTPGILDTVCDETSIMTTYTNQAFKKGGANNTYVVWRKHNDTSKIYFTTLIGGIVPSARKHILGDTIEIVKDFALEVLSGATENIVIVFAKDSSLYSIRSADGGATFSDPVKIASLEGLWSYFYGLRIAACPDGTIYVLARYWKMVMHPVGEEMGEPMDMFGKQLYRSTNFGDTWAAAGKFPYDNLSSLVCTPQGTLVYTELQDANLYVKTSKDGIAWSDSVQVNPVNNTASGYNVGFDTKLVDDATLAVAWIDTTTGNDEIFYRLVSLPEPPLTAVEKKQQVPPTDNLVLQNYPNPFNPATRISFSLPTAGRATLKLYDVLGREVMTIAEK